MLELNNLSNQKTDDVRGIADFKLLKREDNRNSTSIKVLKKL